MTRSLPMRPVYLGYWTAAAMLLGALLGPLAMRSSGGVAKTVHDHSSHEHVMLDIDSASAPTIGLRVERDALSGWNLFLDLDRFAFAPEAVNGPYVPGLGHAHLHVDGVKIARLYGTAFHLPDLEDGRRVITVSLHANDHAALTSDGVPIAAEVVIDAAMGMSGALR